MKVHSLFEHKVLVTTIIPSATVLRNIQCLKQKNTAKNQKLKEAENPFD